MKYFFLLLALLSGLTLLYGKAPPLTTGPWHPILHERLPRLIILLTTGASLATAGAVMQALFQNSLATPSVLGISAGASLSVLITFLLGLDHIFLPLASILGSLITLCFIFLVAKHESNSQTEHLILVGIALSALLFATTGALNYAFRERWELMQMIAEWQTGSSYFLSWHEVHMQLPLSIVGLYGTLLYRKELNLFSLGEHEALNLGVDVEKVRFHLFLLVSLLVGGSIASMGFIPLFGLIVPHIVRKSVGPNHMTLIPLCIVCGAISLSACDLAMRVGHIYFLSIGHLSALVGGLYFFTLLRRRKASC